MKKRVFALCLCLLLLAVATGCHANDATVTPGTYLINGDMNTTYLDIGGDGTFSAGGSTYASYAMFGDATVKGDELLLQSEDSTYTFTVRDDTTLVLTAVEGNAFFNTETGTAFTLWNP